METKIFSDMSNLFIKNKGNKIVKLSRVSLNSFNITNNLGEQSDFEISFSAQEIKVLNNMNEELKTNSFFKNFSSEEIIKSIYNKTK